MKFNQYKKTFSNCLSILTISILLLSFNTTSLKAQSISPMEFGNFSNWGAGHLVLKADASHTVIPDGQVMNLGGITPQAAVLLVPFTKNDNHVAVTITYSPGITLYNGANTISFTPDPLTNTKTYDNQNANHNLTIYIGGKLTLSKLVPAGHYQGSFNVICTYNRN